MIATLLLVAVLVTAAGCASYNSQGDIERDPIVEGQLSFDETNLAAIAQAMGRDMQANGVEGITGAEEFNACSPVLTGQNEEYNVFDYAARELLARYENSQNSSPVLTALEQRRSPEARQAVVAAISQYLYETALNNSSLLALYSQIRQQAYDNYCHKLNSGWGLPRFPRINLQIDEAGLLGLITPLAVDAPLAALEPANIQAYLRSLQAQALQQYCPGSQPQAQFAVCRFSRPTAIAGLRNQQLVIYGEGINLPVNQWGALQSEGYQVSFIRSDNNATYHAPLDAFVEERTIGDFAGHHDVGLRINLPSNLEPGTYRVEIRLNDELIGLEHGFEVTRAAAAGQPDTEAGPEQGGEPDAGFEIQ